MKILVTDDQIDILTLIHLALTEHGFDVDLARDGRQALAMAAVTRYDLILLDLMMPDLNGNDTLKILKRLPLTANTPIVAITAKALRGDEIQITKSGFDGYLFKPFMIDQLISVVGTHVTRQKIGSETGD